MTKKIKNSAFLDFISKNWQPRTESLLDDIKAKRDKNFFVPTGTQVFVGRQGSGKTISAVRQVYKLKERYPYAIICSNTDLSYLKPLTFTSKPELFYKMQHMNTKIHYIRYNTMEELSMALVAVNNGTKGVIHLIDEIHIYFNSLDSKNIPMYVFTEISQQRKQRKCIIGTSQIFTRLAKPFREQCDNIILCNTHMGFITTQIVYDGEDLIQEYDGSINVKKKKMGWFFHNRYIRNGFDTYQKVVSGQEQYEEYQQINLNVTNKRIKVSK